MGKFKEIFSRQPEKMSLTVRRLFSIPVAYAAYLVLGLFIPNTGLFTMALRYILLLLCCIFSVSRLGKIDLKAVISNCGFFRINFFVKYFLTMASSLTLTGFVWFFIEKKSFTYTFDSSNFVFTWISAILLVFFASFTEEFIFRGFIVNFFNSSKESVKKHALVYCLISALFFTFAHFQNPEVQGSGAIYAMIFYFVFGFALMAITIKTNGIEASFGIHFANNAVTALLFGYQGSVIATNSIFTQSCPLSYKVLIQAVLCLLACIWI